MSRVRTVDDTPDNVAPFPGSKVAHGTLTGWTKHRLAGKAPCTACSDARSTYDAARLSHLPAQERNRTTAAAAGRAHARLAAMHPTEYAELYAEEKGK